MPALAKGGNTELPPGTVTIVIMANTHVDVAAMLLRSDDKVRGDSDFVFYNQPTGPGVRHIPGAPDSVIVDTAAVPVDVERIVITASLDGSGPATFGAAGSVMATVFAGGDASAAAGPVATFVAAGLGPVTLIIAVELYRRGPGWKVRAVGQGYAEGLAGLATHHGVAIDDAPAEQQRHGAAAAASTTDPLLAAAAPSAPAPPTPVNLDKGRVSLQKRETVSLVKTGAPPLQTVMMGLGWDPAKRGGNIDLDASVIAYDTKKKPLETVYFGKLSAWSGAINHLGDNLTGQGDGDDEMINIDLHRLPPQVATLVFTVNSYKQQTFQQVKNAYCRLLDGDGQELVRFDLSSAEASTGVFMCRMRRTGGAWEMTAIGEFQNGRTARDMVKGGASYA
jgi:stress response protein SCP2